VDVPAAAQQADANPATLLASIPLEQWPTTTGRASIASGGTG
jgi:hypothetical protein